MNAPACPRCGYDQSGAMVAWERGTPPACPVQSRCTECGLDFLWRDLLNPRYVREPRFFEHAWAQHHLAFLTTLWRAQRPWTFWRWVRLEHPIAPARLAAFGLAGLVAAHVLATAWIVGVGGVVAVISSALAPGAGRSID
jgi:hypothetical protein